jgi:hypothetical protein
MHLRDELLISFWTIRLIFTHSKETVLPSGGLLFLSFLSFAFCSFFFRCLRFLLFDVPSAYTSPDTGCETTDALADLLTVNYV